MKSSIILSLVFLVVAAKAIEDDLPYCDELILETSKCKHRAVAPSQVGDDRSSEFAPQSE